MDGKVSFVVPCLNEGDNLRETIQSLQDTITIDYEIIVIDNGSTDGSTGFLEKGDCDGRIRFFKIARPLGVARARNFGAAFAEGDFIVFTDAHVTFQHNWIVPILDVLNREDVGIVAPAVRARGASGALGCGMYWTDATMNVAWLGKQSMEPYAVPMLPGLCQAFRWDFFHRIEGFDTGMVGYGTEDLEICVRAWLLGYKVFIVPGVEVSHLFRSRAPYELRWTDTVHNLLRAVYAHFHAQRAERVVAAIKSLPCFREAYDLVRDSDIWSRRRSLEVKRIFDDDWFLDKFSMNF